MIATPKRPAKKPTSRTTKPAPKAGTKSARGGSASGRKPNTRKPAGKRTNNKGKQGKNTKRRMRMPKGPSISEFSSSQHLDNDPRKITRVPDGKVWRDNKLRVYCLGGLQEVGRNCTVIEYNDDIIIIDMGLQFPEENMPGVDYVIPNISSLRAKAKNIRGVIITHGHFDHIGGIPHLMPKLGNPPIFMGKLTEGIVQARYQEFPNNPPLKTNTIDSEVKYKLGKAFEIEFVRMNHSIPDTFGVVVHTPVGSLLHTGDFKIDKNNPYDKPADFKKMKALAKKGLRILMADSTNAEQAGEQISEGDVEKGIEQLILEAPGRIFIGTFASMIARIQMVLELAEKHGKKVVLEGRSIHTNVDVAKQLGYIKIKPRTIIEPQEANQLPDNKVIVIGTGAQGQKNAFLMRLATDEHRNFTLKPGDTVVFSSSIIPGNERTIQGLKDTLWRKGARVVHKDTMDVHAGGHCKQEDLKFFYDYMRPEYYVPIEAYHYMLRIHAQLVTEQMGHDRNKAFVADNGQIIEFTQDSARLSNDYVNTEYVFVDGVGVGDVSHVVLRDRVQLASDGMLVVIAQVDSRTGALVGSPDIISRGFVYMKENKELIAATRNKVKQILVDKDPQSGPDAPYLRDKIHNGLSQFVWAKTRRQPMILPVIIQV